MKQKRECLNIVFRVLSVTALIVGLAGIAYAADEGTGEWRATYDYVMSWVNFLILAFVIVRFGKKPLINFLRSEGERTAEEIDTLESEKQDILQEIKKAHQALTESEARFSRLKERIIADGERKKQSIIDTASEQAETMIGSARKKVSHQIDAARQRFRAELIDMAVDIAREQLPSRMTDTDNQRYIDLYLDRATQI